MICKRESHHPFLPWGSQVFFFFWDLLYLCKRVTVIFHPLAHFLNGSNGQGASSRSPTRIVTTPALGPASTALPRPLARSWMRGGMARTWTRHSSGQVAASASMYVTALSPLVLFWTFRIFFFFSSELWDCFLYRFLSFPFLLLHILEAFVCFSYLLAFFLFIIVLLK